MQTLIRIVVILVATGLLVAGWDFSRFVARADRALYKAKTTGRNRVVRFTPD